MGRATETYLENLHGLNPNSVGVGIKVAAIIATKYQHRIPSHDELMDRFGMSRATAYRWIRAFKDARGLQ